MTAVGISSLLEIHWKIDAFDFEFQFVSQMLDSAVLSAPPKSTYL